ncbi:MAG: O-antigen ligase family protein [Cytophagales bacterium]|nr:O-antigen ligase family protein [Cytophagales bacterium]MDW8384062.1 O-antigen ligase family protein [Flammeovirgaceae bacterium]
MFTFFLGYSFHHKTTTILLSIRKFLFLLIVPFIFFPVKFLDRFSVALLFPLILISKNKKQNYLLLAIASLIYSFTYSSATLVIISLFFLSIIIFKDYKAFISFLILLTCVFVVTFIHLIPYLDISQYNYTYQNSEKSIHALMEGHFLLKIDGNTTWRLVLWKQIIVDLFPRNLLGLGFGTPLLKYFPIENYEKIPLLPYVLGAHNSFIYLFGRLGIPAIVLVFIIMKNILKDFFLYRKEYIQHSTEWIFLSFFIISIISLFNPTLESPIYASMFWFFLGLTVRTILSRKHESAL